MPTKAEQSATTRRALLDVARRRFAADGYAGTATERIVEEAGVTRGALYHQFTDKRDLFIAVLEELQAEVLGRIGAATAKLTTTSPKKRLQAAFSLYLDICMEPDVRRILLLDGRSVLGWDEWQRQEEMGGLPVVMAALQAAIDAGELSPQPVEPLAHLLLGAVNEAAFVTAAATDPSISRRELGEALDRLVANL